MKFPWFGKKSSRQDDYKSVLSGVGTVSRDPRLSFQFEPDRLTYQQTIDLWRGDDLAARIVEAWPDEMLRQGFELKVSEHPRAKEIQEHVHTRWEELGLMEKLWKALAYERAYGAGALLLGVLDGADDLALPLNMARIQSLEWITELEPIELIPHTYYGDPAEGKFGEPKTYRLVTGGRGVVAPRTHIIHESRLIIFPGIKVSRHQVLTGTNGWEGESVLNRCWRILRDFNISWSAAGTLIADFAPAVLQIKGLAEIFAQDNTKAFQKRLEALALAQSTLGVRLLDADEKYQRHQTPIAGLPDLMDRLSTRLSAAADMPTTRLMGQSPAGLNATGDSDIRTWYDRIKSAQNRKARPAIERVTTPIIRGFLGGEEPERWSVEFHPLWQPTEKEKADARKVQAEIDNIYLTWGVIEPIEVTESRYGGDEYSFDTVVDMEARAQIEDPEDEGDDEIPIVEAEEQEQEGEEEEEGERQDDHLMEVVIPPIRKRRGNLIARLAGYRVRKAKIALHSCAVCRRPITPGQRYFDGGSGRRAHEDCVPTR